MSTPTTQHPAREQILQVARRLFGERGYAVVTIRQIAAAAGVSPALVMKVAGSKEALYADATPHEPAPLDPDSPMEGLGELLVRRLLDRRDEDVAEPWLRAIYLLHDAPDPVAARTEFRTRFLGHLPADDPDSRRRADLLACTMLGLAAGARSFRLLDPGDTDLDCVVTEYGAIVQGLLDGISSPPT